MTALTDTDSRSDTGVTLESNDTKLLNDSGITLESESFEESRDSTNVHFVIIDSLSVDGMAGTVPTSGRSEPLQRFAEAKEFMGKIYSDLGHYVQELADFYNTIEEDQQKFVPQAKIVEVEQFRHSIRAIKEMFDRDKMKVVFFGRTSNGKSSVINAMLHSRVLPQGMGHTTCCFLQVEGSADDDHYCLFDEDGDRRTPISELDSVGHALSSENIHLASMGKDSLIRVFYPKSLSRLLQHEVVVVDSPGIDVNKEFDSWIDKHCLDADVFVLVVSGEATLTRAEIDFFHRVKDKISKPNILILCNRWDLSTSETSARRELLRSQHESRFIEFLAKTMQVCSEKAARERWFFISAREMLEARLKKKGEIEEAYRSPEFERRLLEFETFESQFEKLISKSAIRTKFESHSNRAREIVEDMRHNLETVANLATREIQRLKLDIGVRNSKLQFSQEQFRKFEVDFLVAMKKLRSDVHSCVYSDFHEEIGRLESIFDRFKYKFGDTPALIDDYKSALAHYVDHAVSTDLQNLCTGALTGKIWQMEERMFAKAVETVGEEYAVELENFIRHRQQPFQFVINVNCASLVRDFHEDLEFRFSLGIESMARRVLAMTRGQPITAIGHNVVRLPGAVNAYQAEKEDVDTFIARVFVQSATYLANGSVGIALAGLIVYKNVDWRWIAGGAGLICSMYAFERYKWDTGAKEERLKDQMRSHLEQRLQLVEQMHTNQCEAQVVNELNSLYGGLKSTVGTIHKTMKSKIDKTNKVAAQMDGFLKGLTSLKGKTNFVNSSLEAFAAKFLVPDSP